MSNHSKDGGSGIIGFKEGEVGSTTTSTIDVSGDYGDDGHEVGDDEIAYNSDEDISTLEDQLRKIDLSLEKLQLEYQLDLELTPIGR